MGNKPFLLSPCGKDYLWGGSRLKEEFHKKISMVPLAESWECSVHPDGTSVIASGKYKGQLLSDILQEHPEFLGTHPRNGFPVLVKFIDATQKLSIQVHPTDEYAQNHENGECGKTEMWYVLDAKPGAELIFGCNQDMEPDAMRNSLEDGTIEKYLRKVPVARDDVFYIPAGTIHAIGEGVLLAEIQQNSNLTYRLYDYERIDKYGRRRELQRDRALEVANLSSSIKPRQPMRVLRYRPGVASELLCRCKYFEVNRMLINTERRQKVTYIADVLSFRVLLCIDGAGSLLYDGEVLKFRKGDCIFIPADSVVMEIQGDAQFLDIRG